MRLRSKDFIVVARDVAIGAGGVENTGSAARLGLELIVAPAQMAYAYIPAADLRNFVDGLFPDLAVNRIADSAAGLGHRYREGHDLFLDVPQTFYSHGSSEALRHAGHILLTDFPTKAGIAVPMFSKSGLGQILESAGISNGWMQISLFDTGIGFLAFSEGAEDLFQALDGSLEMCFDVALDTFGEGALEVALAMSTQNPFLLAGGLQNILAGVISTWNTFSVYVDPLEVFGAAGLSAVLGFGLTHGLLNESLSDATLDAVRSGAIGALYSLSSAFGFGALSGLVVCRLSAALASHHNSLSRSRLTVDEASYEILVRELCRGNLLVKELLERAAPKILLDNPGVLDVQSRRLDDSATTLNNSSQVIREAPKGFEGALVARPRMLRDDAVELKHIYESFSRNAQQ